MWVGYLYTDPEGKGTKMQFAIELGKLSDGKYDGGCKLQVELNGKTYGITTNVTATVSGSELSFKDNGVVKK
jgi:hypothetical protein